MEAGIALLLTGASADLSATIHAVELARRTTGVLHTVCKKGKRGGGKRTAARETPEQLVSLTTRLGIQEGVRVHTHILERLTGEPLIRFLCAHRIFCLVLGVDDRKEFMRKSVWVNLLRHQLQTSENWYLPDLWSAIITPWDASTLELAISEINSRSERPGIFSTVLQHNKKE